MRSLTIDDSTDSDDLMNERSEQGSEFDCRMEPWIGKLKKNWIKLMH